MPRGDGTGPMGMGPMTGRGAGFCNGTRKMFRVFGFQGRRRGGYPGYYGNCWNAVDEKTFLTGEAKNLENRLSQIKDRLADLGGKAE